VRNPEEEATLQFLDACETLPVSAREVHLAAGFVRAAASSGRTLHLPDALIAATAVAARIPLYTCHGRHFPMADVELRVVCGAPRL
jgi:predicted nucleic acid-binding protein